MTGEAELLGRLAAAREAMHRIDMCHAFRCGAAYLLESRARAMVAVDHPECDCGLRDLFVALHGPEFDHNGSSFGSDP